MAEQNFNTLVSKLLLRNDSKANWEAVNPTLLKGEAGVEFVPEVPADAETGTDAIPAQINIKIGDGETEWNSLPYALNVGDIIAQIPDVDLSTVTNNVQVVDSFDDLIAGKVVGDMAIVKAPLFDGASTQFTHTAYVWSGEAWTAMDGNYSAANVLLGSDITLAGSFSSVGNYNKGKTINKGTSLETLLSGMLQQELYPTANDKPDAEITASGGTGEVGSQYTVPTATLKIKDVGSYEYGDKLTGISFAIGAVKLAEGADPATATNYKTNASVMAKDSTLTLKASGDTALYTDSSKSYTFSGTASYEAGKVPVTNLGNSYAAAQIPAGDVTIADKTVTFSGYRYAFAGGTTAASIDSATVRAATAKKSSKASMDTEGEALEFTAAQGATKIFFAYPSTWTGTPYFEMFGLAWAENSDFAAAANIQVADARGSVDGTLQGPVAYKLYVWTPAGPLTAESTKFRVWFK